MAAKKPAEKKPAVALPAGVIASDLTAPKYDSPDRLSWEERRPYDDSGMGVSLLFYQVKGRADRGWVLTTLLISNPSSSQRSRGVENARYYGIQVDDSQICTVGLGPHVVGTAVVHLKKSNIARLQPLIDLWLKGRTDAQTIRDRISSRRARGALRRSGGFDWL